MEENGFELLGGDMSWQTVEVSRRKIGIRGEVLNKTTYRCGFCMGTGLMSAQKGIKCPVCLGSEMANVKSPAVICAYCNGTGRRHQRTTLTCTVCRGAGVVSIGTSHPKTCPVCRGIGRERGKTLPCLTCRGTGVVSSKK